MFFEHTYMERKHRDADITLSIDQILCLSMPIHSLNNQMTAFINSFNFVILIGI